MSKLKQLIGLQTSNSPEDETPFGPGVLTLHRGLEELLSVYTEFNFAIMSLKPGAP